MKKRNLIITVIFFIGIITVSSYGAIESQAIYIPPIGGRLHTVYVSGYVKTESGAGISGATVKITYGDPETGIYRTAITNSAGYYSTSFTTSLYVYATVRATKSGYIGETKSVYTSGSRTVNFVLELYARQFSVYGYAKTPSGTAIGGATIKIYYPNTGSEIYQTTTTATNGYYSLTVVTDLYVYCAMEASKSGYVTDTDTVYSSGTNRVDFTLSLVTHTVTCTGYVRDLDSDAINDATVKLNSPTAGGPTATTYTEATGYYSVSLSTTEYLDYTLEVSKANYLTETIQVYSSGSHTNNFYLQHIFFYDFEGDAIGSNPQNWNVHELQGYTEVSVIDSNTEDLEFDEASKVVKISSSSSLDTPEIASIDNHHLDPTTPVILSFQLIFNTEDIEEDNYGQIRIYDNNVFELLSIKFSSIGIHYSTGGDLIHSALTETFYLGRAYDIDIIFKKDANNKVSFSIYIDQEIYLFDIVDVTANEISYLKFSTRSQGSLSNFYVDNIYFGNVETTNEEQNLPLIIAYPLCRLFRPEVAGVISKYEYGHSRTITLTIELNFGNDYIGFDTMIWQLYEQVLIDQYYGVGLDSDATEDAAVFIRNNYIFDRDEITTPNHEGTYLYHSYNVEHIETKFANMPISEFLGKVDNNEIFCDTTRLYTSGEHLEGIHDYDIPGDGWEDLYREQATSSNQFSITLSHPKVPLIKGKIIYSDVVTAETYIQVSGLIDPHFNYYLPDVYVPVLGIQPYIIKPNGISASASATKIFDESLTIAPYIDTQEIDYQQILQQFHITPLCITENLQSPYLEKYLF